MARYPIELGVVRRMLGEMIGIFELRAVRSLLGRIARYQIELGVVRRMLRENTRYLIEVTAESCVLAEF